MNHKTTVLPATRYDPLIDILWRAVGAELSRDVKERRHIYVLLHEQAMLLGRQIRGDLTHDRKPFVVGRTSRRVPDEIAKMWELILPLLPAPKVERRLFLHAFAENALWRASGLRRSIDFNASMLRAKSAMI